MRSDALRAASTKGIRTGSAPARSRLATTSGPLRPPQRQGRDELGILRIHENDRTFLYTTRTDQVRVEIASQYLPASLAQNPGDTAAVSPQPG